MLIYAHVHEKTIPISCGPGVQPIKWLGHVGIARYDDKASGNNPTARRDGGRRVRHGRVGAFCTPFSHRDRVCVRLLVFARISKAGRSSACPPRSRPTPRCITPESIPRRSPHSSSATRMPSLSNHPAPRPLWDPMGPHGPHVSLSSRPAPRPLAHPPPHHLAALCPH